MRKNKILNLAYVVIGVIASLIIMAQLLLGDIFNLSNKQRLLAMSNYENKSSGEIIIKDDYADIIDDFTTYTEINGLINVPMGTNTDIIVSVNDTTNSTTNNGDTASQTTQPAVGTTDSSTTTINTTINSQQYNNIEGWSKSASSSSFINKVLRLPLDKYSYTIGNRFGDSITGSNGFKELYMGVDFLVTSEGSNVYATLDGIVTDVSDAGDYAGLKVVIENTSKKLRIIYGSLSVEQVKAGDIVKAGDTIGLTGKTTISKTPHLYLEIINIDNGDRYDPEKFSFR